MAINAESLLNARQSEGNIFRRQAASTDKYETPEDALLGKVGRGTVTIPASRRDGSSVGFDHNVPGILNVDPEYSDRSTIDLAKITKASYSQAIMDSDVPHEVFARLVAAPPAPVMQSTFARVSQPAAVAPTPAPLAGISPPEAHPLNGHRAAYPPGQSPEELQATIASLQRALSAQQAPYTPPYMAPAPVPVAPVPAAPSAASMLLPFTDQVGLPGVEVLYHFGNMGMQRAFYHHVVETEDCLVLIYDTRHHGSQYLPPNLNEIPIKVEVGKKSLTVHSLGFNFALGCFDQTVLVKAGPPGG